MPNRMIKESICTSDTIDQLAANEERLFYRLLVNADDFGRFDGRATVVLAACFPLQLDKVAVEAVESWLNKLAEVDLIRFYHVDGRRYLYFTTWDKHQRKRAKHSKYPAPPTDNISYPHDSNTTYICPSYDGQMTATCARETRNENTRNENTRNERRETTDETHAREESVSQSVIDPALAYVMEAYHQHIGVHGPSQFHDLRHWLCEMGVPAEVIVEAITLAAERGKRRMDYINGILNNWYNDGVRTVEEARIKRMPRPEPRASPGSKMTYLERELKEAGVL